MRVGAYGGGLAAVVLLSCLGGCTGQSASNTAAAAPAEAAEPASPPAKPQLSVSKPEWGVRLEPVEVVTPGGVYRFQAEIADDFEERRVGLMNRPSLPEDRGMLFLFPDQEPSIQGFWMKDTLISLDIIYLAPDGRIVSIARNTTPLSEESLPSAGPASAVLEINGGLSDRLGIAPGDRVRHPALAGG